MIVKLVTHDNKYGMFKYYRRGLAQTNTVSHLFRIEIAYDSAGFVEYESYTLPRHAFESCVCIIILSSRPRRGFAFAYEYNYSMRYV